MSQLHIKHTCVHFYKIEQFHVYPEDPVTSRGITVSKDRYGNGTGAFSTPNEYVKLRDGSREGQKKNRQKKLPCRNQFYQESKKMRPHKV